MKSMKIDIPMRTHPQHPSPVSASLSSFWPNPPVGDKQKCYENNCFTSQYELMTESVYSARINQSKLRHMHMLLKCPLYDDLRKEMVDNILMHYAHFNTLNEFEKLTVILGSD